MADTHQAASLSLVGVMDRLWFHHAVIFPEPITVQSLKSPQLVTDSAPPYSKKSSKSSLSDSEESPSVLAQLGEAETIKKLTKEEIIQEDGKGNGNRSPTRKSHTSRKARSESHSPILKRNHSNTVIIKQSTSSKRLEKTTSSKTYEDLEQEEVKGFIDLGFRFKMEHLSPRMMTVVPGLQRIFKTSPENEYLEKNEVGGISTMRPYLSEAWLIKKPNSPLLNMRVRRAYAAADMKKQLKSWARNVATETIQES